VPSSFTRFWDASVGAMVEQHTAALASEVKVAKVAPDEMAPNQMTPNQIATAGVVR